LSNSQNRVITYNVTQDIITSSLEKKTITLNFTGYLYQKNNRYIYFEKPAYKQKVEDGAILLSANGSNISLMQVDTDSLQSIIYTNFDSLEQRMSKFDVSKRTCLNNFEADWQKWDLLPDTMIKNGFHCQKATHTNVNGVLDWEVWFCPDILVRAGVLDLKNLPGLLVEAQFISINKHYSLASQTTGIAIPDTVFWPNEFNVPVTKGVVLKNHGVRKPTKAQKQNDLLNNNN